MAAPGRAAVRISGVGLTAAACLAIAAPVAQAWTRIAQAAGDPQTTWIVTRHTITMRSSDPVLLRFVRGSAVLLGCSSSGQVNARHPPPVVTWGRTASSVTAHVKDPIARHVRVCDAVGVGVVPGFLTATQFSQAPFDAVWRKRLARTLSPGPLLARAQLTEMWDGINRELPARLLNRLGELKRLPPARTLIRLVNPRFNRARTGLRFAPTLGKVTAPGVAYLVGAGSGKRKLELAVIGFDGRRYVLRTGLAARGGPLPGRFGPG